MENKEGKVLSFQRKTEDGAAPSKLKVEEKPVKMSKYYKALEKQVEVKRVEVADAEKVD